MFLKNFSLLVVISNSLLIYSCNSKNLEGDGETTSESQSENAIPVEEPDVPVPVVTPVPTEPVKTVDENEEDDKKEEDKPDNSESPIDGSITHYHVYFDLIMDVSCYEYIDAPVDSNKVYSENPNATVGAGACPATLNAAPKVAGCQDRALADQTKRITWYYQGEANSIQLSCEFEGKTFISL